MSGAKGPGGPTWTGRGRTEGPRLVSTRGMKMNARPKAAAYKKGQQVDGVSGLSG